MSVQIKLRRDTAANWQTINPILASGEPGVSLDTNQWKIGDGVTPWNNLTFPVLANTITNASMLTGTTLPSTVVNSSLQSVGTLTNLTVTNPIVANITGNAATATKLQNTGVTINGQPFNGSSSITVTAAATTVLSGAANELLYQTAAGTTGFVAAPLLSGSFLQWTGSTFVWSTTPNVANNLSGTTLAGNVVSSSLTAVGTLNGLSNSYGYVSLGAYNTSTQGSFSTGAVLDYSSNARISVQSGGFGVYTGGIGTTSIFSVTSTGNVTIPGNLACSGLEIISPAYFTESTAGATVQLSSITSCNMIVITSSGLSLTINMPLLPTNGQVCQFNIVGNAVTLVQGTGSTNPAFATSSAPAGTGYKYVYQASTSAWYAIK